METQAIYAIGALLVPLQNIFSGVSYWLEPAGRIVAVAGQSANSASAGRKRENHCLEMD